MRPQGHSHYEEEELSDNRRTGLNQNISFQEVAEGNYDGKESKKLSDGQLVKKYVDSAKKPKKNYADEVEFTEYHENIEEEESNNLKSIEISKAQNGSHMEYQGKSASLSNVNNQIQMSGTKQKILQQNTTSELSDRAHIGESREELLFRTKEEWAALDKKNLIANDRKLLPRVGVDEHIQLIESADQSLLMKDKSISRLTTEKKERVTEEFIGTEAKEGREGTHGRDLSLVGYTNNMTPNSRDNGQLTPFSRLESTQPKEQGFRPELREEGINLRFKDIQVDRKDYAIGGTTVQASDSREGLGRKELEQRLQFDDTIMSKQMRKDTKDVDAQIREEREGNSQKTTQQSVHQTQLTTIVQESTKTKEHSTIEGGQSSNITVNNLNSQRSQNGMAIAGLATSQVGDSARGLTGYAQTVQTVGSDSDSSRVRINRPGVEYQLSKQTVIEANDTANHRLTTDANVRPSEGLNKAHVSTYSPSQISHGSLHQSGREVSPRRNDFSAAQNDFSRTIGQNLHLNNSTYELHERNEGATRYYHPPNPSGQLFPTNRQDGLNHNYNSTCYVSSGGRNPITNNSYSTVTVQEARRTPHASDGGLAMPISNHQVHYLHQTQQIAGNNFLHNSSSYQSLSRGILLPQSYDPRRLQDNPNHSPSREQRRNRLDSPEKRELSPILPESGRHGFKFLPDLHSSQWAHPGFSRGGHTQPQVLQHSKYPGHSIQSSNSHQGVQYHIPANLNQHQKSTDQRGLNIRPSQTTTHNERNESSTYVSYQSSSNREPAPASHNPTLYQIDNKQNQSSLQTSLANGNTGAQQPISDDHMKQYNLYTSNLSKGNALQVQGIQAGLRTNVMETQYSNIASQRIAANQETPQKDGPFANIDGTAQSKFMSVEFTPMNQSVTGKTAQYSGLRVLGTETIKRPGSNERVQLVHQGEDFKVYQYFTKTKSSIVVKDSYSSNQGPETVSDC